MSKVIIYERYRRFLPTLFQTNMNSLCYLIFMLCFIPTSYVADVYYVIFLFTYVFHLTFFKNVWNKLKWTKLKLRWQIVIVEHKTNLEVTVQHLFKFIHGGSTSGFVEQAHLPSQHGVRSPIDLHRILDPALDHNRPLIPHSTVHLHTCEKTCFYMLVYEHAGINGIQWE